MKNKIILDCEIVKQNISKSLLKNRKRINKTQNQLINEIENCNISLKTYKNYENGKTLPELDKLIILAHYFGCTIDSLIYGNETIKNESTLLTDNLKRLACLIGTGTLMPIVTNDFSDCKYVFISSDKEVELFINKLNDHCSIKNYYYNYYNVKITNLLNDFLNIAEDFIPINRDFTLTKERLKRISEQLGENFEEYVIKQKNYKVFSSEKYK